MNKKIKNFNHLNVWVIGASSGIGREICLQLANQGASVFASSRKLELLNSLALESKNKIIPLQLDVLKTDEIENQLKSIPSLDMVIYLAADYTPMSIEKFDAKTANHIIDVNLKGAINITSYVLPIMMKNKKGHISYFASLAGYIGLPQSSVYGATKAAIMNMAESLHPEAKKYNIDISIVNPGFVKTNLTAKNDFDMPMIMTPEKAATLTLAGYQQGHFDIVYPKTFSYFFRILRILPYNLHLKLAEKLIKA